MRISDWSSDVCSSDLAAWGASKRRRGGALARVSVCGAGLRGRVACRGNAVFHYFQIGGDLGAGIAWTMAVSGAAVAHAGPGPGARHRPARYDVPAVGAAKPAHAALAAGAGAGFAHPVIRRGRGGDTQPHDPYTGTGIPASNGTERKHRVKGKRGGSR